MLILQCGLYVLHKETIKLSSFAIAYRNEDEMKELPRVLFRLSWDVQGCSVR